MFANVTFFEQTSYFSSFVQDIHYIQQILPIPLVEFTILSASKNPSPDHYLPTQDPDDPMLLDESSSSSSSPSSLNTTYSFYP